MNIDDAVKKIKERARAKHWLCFYSLEYDKEITIKYSHLFDLNDNKCVDDQCYRAGRRLKRLSGKHSCSKTPEMNLLDWSNSFDDMER